MELYYNLWIEATELTTTIEGGNPISINPIGFKYYSEVA